MAKKANESGFRKKYTNGMAGSANKTGFYIYIRTGNHFDQIIPPQK